MNPPTPTPEQDRLADRLHAAAGGATTSPDARRRIERRVVVRRRQAVGRRTGVLVALTAVGVAGVVATRRDEGPTAVSAGASTASTAAPGTTAPAVPFSADRLVPSYLPDGYQVQRVGQRTAGPLAPPATTDPPIRSQLFRPPGTPAGTGPSIWVGNAADFVVPPDGPETTAGPWTIRMTRFFGMEVRAWFHDGPRAVMVTSASKVSEDDVRAFVATLRWDDGAARYTATGNPAGLVERAIFRERYDLTVRVSTVNLRRPGYHADIEIETKIDEQRDALEAMGAETSDDVRPLDVGGRPAVLGVSRLDGKMASVTVSWADGSYTVLRSAGLPDIIAGQLQAQGKPPLEGWGDRVSDDELIAVARSLRTVDQATWDALPH